MQEQLQFEKKMVNRRALIFLTRYKKVSKFLMIHIVKKGASALSHWLECSSSYPAVQ